MKTPKTLITLFCLVVISAPGHPRDNSRQVPPPPPGPGGPGDPGPGTFMLGPGGPGGMGQVRKLVSQFDKDADKRLNSAERTAAREFLQKERAEGRGPRG